MGRPRKAYRLWKRSDRGGVYYWSTPEDSEWKSTGETSRDAAIKVAVGQLGTRAQVGILKELSPAEKARVARELLRPTERVTLREFLEPYFTDRCPHCQHRKVGAGHRQQSRGLLDRHVLTDPVADLPVGMITRGDLLDLRQRLINGKGPGTANKVLTALHTCLREGLFREELSRDLAAGVGKVAVEREEPGTFTAAELAKLFAEVPGPRGDRVGYTCFLVAASVGMRMSEILALPWKHVDFDRGLVRVERAWKYKHPNQDGLPKRGKKRVSPLPARTAKALRELRAESTHVLPDGPVFCQEDGSRLTDDWWAWRFRSAMKAAGIDTRGSCLKPHSFRHSPSTILQDQGVDAQKSGPCSGGPTWRPWRSTPTGTPLTSPPRPS